MRMKSFRWVFPVAAILYQGAAIANQCISPPVSCRVSSPWGMRIHPVLKTQKMHKGVDYACPEGTPIRAAHGGNGSGLVHSGGGNIAKVNNGNIETKYMHTRFYSVPTAMGSAPVAQGDIIASSGNTGAWTTGPHLHFEVYAGGVNVNPATYICGGAKPEGGDSHKDGTQPASGSAQPVPGYTVQPEDPPVEMEDGSLMIVMGIMSSAKTFNPEWHKNVAQMSEPRLLGEISILRSFLMRASERKAVGNQHIMNMLAQIQATRARMHAKNVRPVDVNP